jgi:predicted nucleic acid-binding protein
LSEAGGGLLYLDSSAIVKLVWRKPETGALLELLSEWPERVSSEVTCVEVSRAVRRAGGDPDDIRRAGEILDRLGLIHIDAEVLSIAAEVSPELRSLDAIHLATALSLGDDLGALAAYDERLARAATANGLITLSPE